MFDRGPFSHPDSTPSILSLRESVIEGYWEVSGRTRQTTIARRYGVLTAGGTRWSITDVPNVEDFDRDRWLLMGLTREPLPSPIAANALKHYAFSLLDTVMVEGRRAFRLSIRPNSSERPAFDGIIDVADSTFDILTVDVGIAQTVDKDLDIIGLRERLRFADVGAGRWMPVAIETTLRGSILDVTSMGLQLTATLGNFRLNGGAPSRLIEYPFVVANGADAASKGVYAKRPPVPLTPAETLALKPFDSVPLPWWLHINLSSNMSDIRFNRVDGWTPSLGGAWRAPAFAPSMAPTVRLGYALGSRHWSYLAGDQLVLSAANRVSIGALFHDETVTSPVFASDRYNPTFGAVLAGAGADNLNYHRERGVVASASTRLIALTQLSVSYTDARQSSLSIRPRYATLSGGRFGLVSQPNAPILDGQLHALSASISYDSRPMLLEPHGYARLSDTGIPQPTASFTTVSLETELSAPATLGGDFTYRRSVARITRSQQWGALGSTTLTGMAGLATGNLPPQRYFDIDGGASLSSKDTPFSTLGDSVLGGSRAAAVTVEHVFPASLLKRSGIPGIRSLPIDFAVHGGAFWSTFAPSVIVPRGAAVGSAPSGYREVGFTAGYRIPFLPFELAVRVGRRLSRYPTSGTRLTIGFWD